jgi:phosphoglycerate dehydrogenase-like enzyme
MSSFGRADRSPGSSALPVDHNPEKPGPTVRILLSHYAYDHWWSMIGGDDIEPVILGTDGGLRLADGQRVDPEEASPDVLFGTFDLFVEGGAGEQFMGLASTLRSIRWLASPSAGHEGPLFASIANRGARITASHHNGPPIAEYVLRAVLDNFQRASEWRAGQERREWVKHEFREVGGSTWLVIGLGSIGGRVAQLAQAFGATVIGCRRHPDPSDPTDRSITLVELPSVLGEVDVVVLATPGGSATEHLVDDEFLQAMKPGSVLVNVARGSVVDEAALLAGLERGVPTAAMLDVVASEPLAPDSPLWDHPAVTLTPHNAAGGDGRGRRQAQAFADNLARLLAGEPMAHEITDLVRTAS